jgi:hypothetical protein
MRRGVLRKKWLKGNGLCPRGWWRITKSGSAAKSIFCGFTAGYIICGAV